MNNIYSFYNKHTYYYIHKLGRNDWVKLIVFVFRWFCTNDCGEIHCFETQHRLTIIHSFWEHCTANRCYY